MSDSSLLIKRYFYSVHSEKINSAINQIELIVEMAAEFTKADFAVLYHRHKDDESLTPLAFHNMSESNIDNINESDSIFEVVDLQEDPG